MRDTVVTDKWIEEFSKGMARETLKLIVSSNKSKMVTKDVTKQFLSHFIQLVLLDCLNEYKSKKLGNQRSFEFTHKNYKELKMDVQNAVSDAFHEAFVTYSNMSVDYYCEIKPIPAAINKEPI